MILMMMMLMMTGVMMMMMTMIVLLFWMLWLLLLLKVKFAEATSHLKHGMDTATQAESVSGKSTALLNLVFERVAAMHDSMRIILRTRIVAVMNVVDSQKFELA